MLRHMVAMGLVMGLVSCAEPVPGPTGSIALRASVAAPIRADGHGSVLVTVENTGASAITLVRPGDGSEVGWRTPRTAFFAEPASTFTSAPAWPAPRPIGRCGNINPLRRDQVVTLQPGETFEYYEPVYVEKAGKHVIVLYYRNEPGMTWSGVPLGEHDGRAMRAVRSSNPAEARVELTVDVLEAVAKGP